MLSLRHRVALLCATVAAAACTVTRVPPPSTDIDETGFREDLRTLASDEFEGRRPGTPGEDKTVAYLVDQYKKLGLKPAQGETYLQPVPMVEITAGRDASLSVSGHGGAQRLTYARDMVIWTPRAVPAAALQHSELVFVGYGIVAPEYGWNDYAKVDVHGKTVVVLVNDPGYGSKDPKTFKGDNETYYGRWTYKVAEATRRGAAGILLIHDRGAAGEPWNAVLNSRTGPQLELAATADQPGSAPIEGWITQDAGRALFTRAGLDFDGLTAAAARPGFHAASLGLSVDAAVQNAVRRFTSANVVGVLSGGNRKHEYVIYGAHWDHLGRRDAPAAGATATAIYNGAVDNASGVAGLLMLAQSFGRTRPVPDRSIVFIAFTGEESGLLGSDYYVHNPLLPLRATVAYLNLDTLHIGGPTRDVMVFGYGNSELEDDLRNAVELHGQVMRPDPNPELGLYYRSDQLSFANIGVPALYAQGGLDDSARGPAFGQAQREDYREHRYRQTGDKYTADWDVRGTLEDLRLYYEVGMRLSRTRRFPRWYPNSEFRVSRQRASDSPEP